MADRIESKEYKHYKKKLEGKSHHRDSRSEKINDEVKNDKMRADNEEDLGGRPAFLFGAGNMRGVTLDSSGANLPQVDEAWQLLRCFTLGVRDVGVSGLNPEAIIRAIRTRGSCVWQQTSTPQGESTSQ